MKKLILATIALGALLTAPAVAADYKIMAPAAPGGGWDQTARTMQSALQDEKISGSVQSLAPAARSGLRSSSTRQMARRTNSSSAAMSWLVRS